MGIKLFVPGDSITATNYAGTTAIIGSNYNVDYSEGQTITLVANGLLGSILVGGHGIHVCGQTCEVDESASDDSSVTCVVPAMITMYSEPLYEYTPIVLEAQSVQAHHTIASITLKRGFEWLNRPWEHYLERDTCQLTLGGPNIKLDSLHLKIKHNHWWPPIKFVVEVSKGGEWFMEDSFEWVRGGAATHIVDLSHIHQLTEGVKIIGNVDFCRFVETVALKGIEVSMYDQPIKECPLVVLALHQQCVNDYDSLASTVIYAEASASYLEMKMELEKMNEELTLAKSRIAWSQIGLSFALTFVGLTIIYGGILLMVLRKGQVKQMQMSKLIAELTYIGDVQSDQKESTGEKGHHAPCSMDSDMNMVHESIEGQKEEQK